MSDPAQTGNAKTYAQTTLNALCLAGLYAAAWTGRLGWVWVLGAVGLSMAWVTPAVIVQALQIYARAVYAPPPPSASTPGSAPPSAPSGPPAAGASGSHQAAPHVESMPSPPPGIFGFIALVRELRVSRAIPAFAVMVLLSGTLSGCTRAQGDNVGNVFDAVWKVVTNTCSTVRTVTPFVEMVRPRPLDASPDDAPDASAD